MEAGCGIGGWCERFQRRGHEIVGIEYNEDIVRRAKEFNPEIDVVLGDVTGLNYPNNSFDIYISLGVIEHFENGPERALKEAYRILKPGGLAFVSTPYLNVLRRLICHPVRSTYFLIRKLKGRPNYFWEYRFARKELESYIEKAGFEIIEAVVDDYEPCVRNRHIGLWADWFFIRAEQREIWELSKAGKLILRMLSILPRSCYSSGIMLVARVKKETN